MLRLRTLGALHAVSDDGEALTGAAAQRRILALLALLAVAGDGGLSRDKIVGLLWPDTDPERARHSLTQALYTARRALGADDLFVADADVRLNRERITSDLAEFEAALDAGDLERAASIYGGPFLDGFYLSGSAEFEQWLFAQRTRLDARAGDAFERLAEAAQAAGDVRRVVDWRRRIAVLQPLDASAAAKLMTALANAGDRAGALQHARVHEMLLREQLDLGPDPVVVALAERLREPIAWAAEPAPDAAPEPVVIGGPSSDRAWMPAATTTHEPAGFALAVANGPSTPAAVEVLVPERRVRAWVWLTAVLVLILAMLLGVRIERRLASSAVLATLPVRQQVVVAPFRVAGANPALAYLRDGMVELLSTRLADDTSSRSVDAGAVLGAWRDAGLRGTVDVPRDTIVRLAKRLGAERVVIGSVVGTPSRAVLGATVVSVATGVVSGTATVEGPIDSLTTLVDRLAARLLTAEAGEDDHLADQTTTSLRALRAYLDGQTAYRQSSYGTALRHYDRALDADSSFALAGLHLALAAGRLNDAAQEAHGVAAAWPFRGALSERDRAQLVALAGPRYPAPSPAAEQIAAWERVVDVAPNRAEAWFQLGARLFHDGASAGLPSASTRAAGALQHALTLDPSFAPARQLLAQLAPSASDSIDAAGPLGAVAPYVRWRHAAVRHDAAGLRRVRDTLALLGPATLRAISLTSLFEGIGVDDGVRALHALRARALRSSDRVDAVMGEHAFALVQGRTDAALDATSRLRELEPTTHAHLRLRVLDALYDGGDVAAATAAAGELARSTTVTGTTDSAVRLADLCAVTQWRLARGDTSGAADAISRLTASPASAGAAMTAATEPHTCAELVRTSLAITLGAADAPARVRHLDSLVLAGPAAGDAAAYAPLLVARMHDRLGDAPGALAALRRRSYMSGWPRYAAAMWREEARLALRVGDAEGARAASARYEAVRGEAGER